MGIIKGLMGLISGGDVIWDLYTPERLNNLYKEMDKCLEFYATLNNPSSNVYVNERDKGPYSSKKFDLWEAKRFLNDEFLDVKFNCQEYSNIKCVICHGINEDEHILYLNRFHGFGGGRVGVNSYIIEGVKGPISRGKLVWYAKQTKPRINYKK